MIYCYYYDLYGDGKNKSRGKKKRGRVREVQASADRPRLIREALPIHGGIDIAHVEGYELGNKIKRLVIGGATVSGRNIDNT